MRLKWQKAIYLATLGMIVVSTIFGLQNNSQQNEPLFLWPELRSEVPIGLQLSPDRRFILYSKADEPGMVIRRLKDDLSLGEIICDTNSRRMEKKELELGVEWMAGNKLLVYLAEGVTDFEDLEHRMNLYSQDPEKNPAPPFKLLILDPFTGEETPFPATVDASTYFYTIPIIVHPDRDKFLIGKKEATFLYSFPSATELARITEHGDFLAWCPDKQRFWGLVAIENDEWIVKIVVTDIMKNEMKVLLEKEWKGELYSIRLERIGEAWGWDSIGNLRFYSYDHVWLVEGKEIAILAYKTKAGKLVFIYFSPDGIARERELSEKMLPDELKKLGECWVIEMLPNGRELLIRQGNHYSEEGKRWQKCWYWLWEMDSGSVKRVGYFGELTIIDWIGPREALVSVTSLEEVNGEEKVFHDHGILRLP